MSERDERTPHCDHKFIDSKSCLKCGWVPPDPRTPSQVAEDEAREARECLDALFEEVRRLGGSRHPYGKPKAHTSFDRALAAARWAQQETAHVAMCRCHNFADDGTGDCYLDCPTNPPDGTAVAHPYIDSRCAAERDRLRREWEEASK